MGFLNRTRHEKGLEPPTEGTDQAHLNFMGGPSYDLEDPLLRLRVAASSCFFGEPMYYHRDPSDDRPARQRTRGSLSDEQVAHLREVLDARDPREWRSYTPADLMERSIDDALACNAEATLREAVRLRQEEHIRTTPQVMLVRAAHHPAVRGTDLLGRHAPGIIARADEPAVGLAYQLMRYGRRPIPMGLRRAWRRALEGFDAHQLAKYRMGARAVKTVDVVNLVHAKGEAIDRLMRGELTTEGATWESIISREGSTRESWERAIEVAGHMAMLRNVRNFLEKGVDPALFVEKLLAGARTGKQLPFRYWSAYQAVKESPQASGPVLDALEQCLMLSLGNLPTFPGRVMSLVDNSGSAQGAATSSMGRVKISVIGNLTGVLTGMRAEDGYIGVFGDGLETTPVRKGSSVFDQVEGANRTGRDIGLGTENGIWLFWDKAIHEKQHWDTVFVYSDMQAGHGGLYGLDPQAYADFIWGEPGSSYIDVPRLIATYRKRVNPKVVVFLVQIAGHKDTIVPEFYDRTFILGGWSDAVLRFAAEMQALCAGGEGETQAGGAGGEAGARALCAGGEGETQAGGAGGEAGATGRPPAG